MAAPVAHGRFLNLDGSPGSSPGWKVLRWLLTRRLPQPAPFFLPQGQYHNLSCRPDDIRVTFIGHCTLLVEMGGRRILTDPIFSDFASPLKRYGPRRFHAPGIPLGGLPPIDVVLVSHNHYDHLDKPTIQALGDGPEYVVPKGLGRWFRRNGCTKVTELAWWEEGGAAGLQITAVPCQHWSKRTLWDERRSLWCGFAVAAGEMKFLFIGDSGYSPCFSEIGNRLGPFHVAALPIGAYEPSEIMKNVHMTPEEALHAFLDVKATVMVPTHFGCFPLTDEEVGDPPRRLWHAWMEAGLDQDHLWMLVPGQWRDLEHLIYIPVVRSSSRRVEKPREWRRQVEVRHREWSIAICPHKGDMVDLEAFGARDEVFEGDRGQTLLLKEIHCSGFGDHAACNTGSCPLRDPAFLRSHDLHGIHREDGGMEAFIEIDNPPDPHWWQSGLEVSRKTN